jgi:sugar O-acyltransferase (sialic acid O-acetyltransferase NeuD family)
MHLYGIFGIGGFAREVMPICKQMLSKIYAPKDYELVFVTEKQSAAGQVNGYRVCSEEDFSNSSVSKRFFNIAIADSRIRERIANDINASVAEPFSVFAENYVTYDATEIGTGAIFCPFSMVTSNAKIGRFFHANYYSCVTHDCVIGDFVTFAPGVQCNGGVIIEDHAYIGAGAIIKQSTFGKPLVIGEGAVVGMGAVVTKSVPPYTTVAGNPAKPLVK